MTLTQKGKKMQATAKEVKTLNESGEAHSMSSYKLMLLWLKRIKNTAIFAY
ncbi:MAG: hypothetical protein LE169_01410 [Endomicrobium sp.]|nr:hypothetical protein [Endomicrobium sp.]